MQISWVVMAVLIACSTQDAMADGNRMLGTTATRCSLLPVTAIGPQLTPPPTNPKVDYHLRAIGQKSAETPRYEPIGTIIFAR